MATTRFLVDGMTCEHCVAAVTAEVSAVDGVREVTIDLVPGDASTVSITSASPITLADWLSHSRRKSRDRRTENTLRR